LDRSILQAPENIHNASIMAKAIQHWDWASSTRPAANARRIGLWAISANPPHRSHVTIAQEALEKERLDALIVILSREHVNKPEDGATFEQRRTMTELAFSGIPNIFIVIAQSGRYLQHVRSLRQHFPLATAVLLMGVDNLMQMSSFNTPQDLALFASLRTDILVHPRQGDETGIRKIWAENPDEWPQTFVDRIRFRSTEADPMSSSDVRQRIAENNPDWADLVPADTADFIRRTHLYRPHSEHTGGKA